MENFDEDLPEKVVTELRTRMESRVTISDEIDAAVLADAEHVLRAAKPQRSRRFARWTLGMVSVGSLAAALLIFIRPQVDSDQETQTASSVVADASSESSDIRSETASADAASSFSSYLKQDIDRDGNVDILDAFALARQIGDSSAGTAGDQNGDGVVDNADVDLVALTAVML